MVSLVVGRSGSPVGTLYIKPEWSTRTIFIQLTSNLQLRNSPALQLKLFSFRPTTFR